uniref:Nodule-specific cysteine-rich peptide G03 n=1 Tax=Pisum sativum TaxID=3888 RepID=A0A7T8DV72_PEA|nr:nodule-specific cysteine-rich peptide G03 [Pisum sativum]
MAKTFNFVYALILFLFLFLIAKNIEANNECTTDFDCPKSIVCMLPYKWKCVGSYCEFVKVV